MPIFYPMVAESGERLKWGEHMGWWDEQLWEKLDFPLDDPIGGCIVYNNVTKQVFPSIPLAFLVCPVPLD